MPAPPAYIVDGSFVAQREGWIDGLTDNMFRLVCLETCGCPARERKNFEREGYILMRNETGDTKDGWIDTCSVSPHSTESSATHPSLGRYRDETSSSSLLDSSCKPNH
ncbi:hypothetical protein AMECASPLE_011088, partial [Ameca splendens]